jgi:tripartite-type tricarboxylate transporter receptor subunit TctC
VLKVLKTFCVGALAVSATATAAYAEWPKDRPIEIIVAFAPGGSTDVMARAMQPFLEKELGAKIVIVNKPGASGEIAYTALPSEAGRLHLLVHQHARISVDAGAAQAAV